MSEELWKMWLWLLWQKLESICTFISYCYLSSSFKGPLMSCWQSLEMSWISNNIFEAWENIKKNVNMYKWFAAAFCLASQWLFNFSSTHITLLMFYLKNMLQWNICWLERHSMTQNLLQNCTHRPFHYLNAWWEKCSMHFLPPMLIFILQ